MTDSYAGGGYRGVKDTASAFVVDGREHMEIGRADGGISNSFMGEFND